MHQPASACTVCLCCAVTETGTDFTPQGFDAMLEYLYTSAVEGATERRYNVPKMQSTLKAAGFFGLPKLAEKVNNWAEASGLAQRALECELPSAALAVT